MSEDSGDSRTIFVGNLSPDVTEEILYELFLQSGPVEEISIPKKDGKNRAFGFVTYAHQVSVPYALKLYEGTRLYGRELNLKNRNSNSSFNNNNSHIQSNNFPQIAPFVNNLNNMQPMAMPNPALMFGFNNIQPNPSLLQQALHQNIQKVLQANMQSQLNMYAMSTQSTTSNFLSSTPTSSRDRDRGRDRDSFADRHRRNDYRDKPYARSRSRSRSPRSRRDIRDDSPRHRRDRDRDRDDSPRSRRNGSPTRRNFYRR